MGLIQLFDSCPDLRGRFTVCDVGDNVFLDRHLQQNFCLVFSFIQFLLMCPCVRIRPLLITCNYGPSIRILKQGLNLKLPVREVRSIEFSRLVEIIFHCITHLDLEANESTQQLKKKKFNTCQILTPNLPLFCH